jgi:hypothetical protein
MCAMEREKHIFEAFNKALPQFSGETIKEWDVVEEWYERRHLATPAAPLDKRPDVIALTATDNKIGIELKSWLNEQQIAEARRRVGLEEGILRAIGDQGQNRTRHIDFIWMSPKQIRLNRNDTERFRQEIFALIERVDEGWSAKDEWEQEHNEIINDLSAFPILERYLNHVDFHPSRRGKRNIRWITFPARGAHYDPQRMRQTLIAALLDYRLDGRYEALVRLVGLNEIYLLVHYDFNAFAYNHPFDEPGFGFREVSELATNTLAGNAGHFDRVFLFHCLQGEEEAYRIV